MGVKVWIFSRLLLKFQKHKKEKETLTVLRPHSSLMKSDKWFNKDMNTGVYILMFLSLVQFCLLQSLRLCWLDVAWIRGIPRLSRLLLLQYSSHVSACSLALICACSFSPLLPFPRLSFCPRGKLLLHDTKVLHITVRKVCHAVCPEAILDLNGNCGNGKRDGLRRDSVK